jgi:hypothetical protein
VGNGRISAANVSDCAIRSVTTEFSANNFLIQRPAPNIPEIQIKAIAKLFIFLFFTTLSIITAKTITPKRYQMALNKVNALHYCTQFFLL